MRRTLLSQIALALVLVSLPLVTARADDEEKKPAPAAARSTKIGDDQARSSVTARQSSVTGILRCPVRRRNDVPAALGRNGQSSKFFFGLY